VDVVDTTGAGDAFNAGFIYATNMQKQSLPEAMRFAAACGAQAVTQVGGATNAPDADSILELLAQA
jgi:ribokinase